MKNVPVRIDRAIIAHIANIHAAAGNAALAYLNGGQLSGHLRLIRAELAHLEEINAQRKKHAENGAQGLEHGKRNHL